MTLGQRIQELRKAHDLSQEALGEKLGVSRQAISRWEMDGAVPEVDKLIQLAKLFGVSLNDLLQVETGGGEAQSPIVLAPPRGWKLWNIILTLLTAAALISTAVLGWRNAALLERQAALEASLAQQQEILTRQAAALADCAAALERAANALDSGLTYDICADDIREALAALGTLCGRQAREDVLTEICSRFCVGK